MAGHGPAPKDPAKRRNTNQAPIRGEWKATAGVGWQHGALPPMPDGLMPSSQTAWTTWFQSWFASHWTPDNLPDLRTVIRLYDQVERGEYQRAAELRLWEDGFGITLKGQQDRRWSPPKPEEAERPTSSEPTDGRYGHLRVAGGAG